MNKKDFARLRRDLEAQGWDVTMSATNHYIVRTPEGRFAAGLPRSPGEGRGFRNAMAQLRRAGYVPSNEQPL